MQTPHPKQKQYDEERLLFLVGKMRESAQERRVRRGMNVRLGQLMKGQVEELTRSSSDSNSVVTKNAAIHRRQRKTETETEEKSKEETDVSKDVPIQINTSNSYTIQALKLFLRNFVACFVNAWHKLLTWYHIWKGIPLQDTVDTASLSSDLEGVKSKSLFGIIVRKTQLSIVKSLLVRWEGHIYRKQFRQGARALFFWGEYEMPRWNQKLSEWYGIASYEYGKERTRYIKERQEKAQKYENKNEESKDTHTAELGSQSSD